MIVNSGSSAVYKSVGFAGILRDKTINLWLKINKITYSVD